MKNLLFFLFLLLNNNLISQCTNGGCGLQLVPNPGFELSTGTSTISGSTVMPLSLGPVQNWVGTDNTGSSTPDYHNLYGVIPAPNSANANNYACTSGNGMTGIFTRAAGSGNGREYIQVQLTSPLIAGRQYCFSMVVKSRQTASPPAPPGNVLTRCDGIGAWFHNQGLIDINTMNGGAQFIGAGSLINAIPQINNAPGNLIAGSCQTIIGTFCALGGENYIVIGNFKDNANTIMVGAGTSNYMYIDDVSLKESCNTPLITSVIASPLLVCSGSCSTLSATATGGSGTYTYTWQPGGQSTRTLSVCPNITTTYTLLTGSSSTCLLPQTYSTVMTVSVTPAASLTVNSPVICANGTATLIASGSPSYTWSAGLSSTSGSIVTGSPSVTTVYTVTGGSGNCNSSPTTFTVTVVTSVNISSPSNSICLGQTATLNASGASSYTWLPNNSTGPTFTDSPLSNTNYTVIGTIGSCTGSVVTSIFITPTPIITVNSTTICAGISATLTASGASNYVWSAGVTPSNGSVVTVNPLTTTIYTVTGSVGSCSIINTSTVSVIPIPTITVTSSTICANGTGTFTANGATTYNWSSGLSSTTASVVTGSPITTTTYTVIGILGGCNSAVVTPTITVIPLVNISAPNNSICLGQTATLTASGATSYTWLPNNSTGSIFTNSPLSNTNYTVIGSIGSCTGSVVASIVIIPIPTISVNSTTICAGSVATLTANGVTNYFWSAGTSPSSGSVVAVNPLTTTIYTVTGSVGSCSVINTSTVSIIPIPTITVTSSTICSIITVTLTASGATTYSWSAGLNSTTGSVVTGNPSGTTIYTVTGNSGGCNSAPLTSTITTNHLVIISASSVSICVGQTATLTASGATTYTWIPNNVTGTTFTALPAFTTTYTVIGATGTCTNSAVVVITAAANPILTPASNPTICSGSSFGLNVSGANTYTWTANPSLSATGIPNPIASPASTTTYSVNGTSALGCVGSTVIVVSVVQTPTVSNILAPVSGNICAGESIILSAFGAANYGWSPGATLSGITGSPVTATPNQTTVYTVVGTNGTAPNTCVTSKTITITVRPNAVPVASPRDSVCLGANTIMFANGGNTYSWAPNTGVSSPNDSVTLVSPNITTVYTVTASNNGLCPGTATVEIIVNPLPTLNAGQDTTVNIDETITLYGTGNVPVGFNTTNGSFINCNFCPIVTVNPQDNTCYVLKGTNGHGCVNTDVVCVTVTKDWNVYISNAFTPNGDVDNEFFIPISYGTSQIKLWIYDRWGHEIFKSADDTTAPAWDGKNKGVICQQGVYVYQVEIKTMSGKTIRRTGHVTLLPNIR